MAVTDAYTTAALYRGITKKTDTGEDTQIGIDLLAISRYMDRKLHRFFTKDASVVARKFWTSFEGRPSYGPTSFGAVGYAESENPWRGMRGQNLIRVDDISSATGLIVKIDLDHDGTQETTLASSDYQLWPRNAAVGPEPKPYTALYLPSWSTYLVWPPLTEIEITATWGWPSVPPAIADACAQLTGILRLETPRATRAISSIEDTIEASPSAMRIIYELMNVYGKVVMA